MAEVYEIIHTNPLIKNVLDYIQDNDSPAFNYKDNPDSFLLVKSDVTKLTNRQVIENTYHTTYEKGFIGKSAKDLLLKVGTKLYIEKQKANQAGLLTEGLEVVSNDVNAFKARALAQLESQESYKTSDTLRPIKGKLQLGTAKEIYPDATVWIWCKSLANASNNFEGEIFNVTPFIQSVSTSVTNNGGNFQIVLPPLVCEKNNKGYWSIKKSNIQYYTGNKKKSLQNQGYVADGNLYQTTDGEDIIRNNFLFHTILNTNDLVFIRFETLQLEQDQREVDSNGLFVSKSHLPNRIYDMIGLVDINNSSIKSIDNGVDVSVNVNGRDLTKLLIEDGAYFFITEMNQGMLGGPGSATTKAGSLAQRLSNDNGLQYLSLYFNNTIDKVFKFVLNQLSNIKIVPDNLFIAYGNRRNTRYTDNKSLTVVQDDINAQIEELKKQAIGDIVNLRLANDLTLDNAQDEKKKVYEIFTNLKNFLKAIRINNVRHVLGSETMGWFEFKYQNERGVQELITDNAFPAYFNDNLYSVYETRVVPEAKDLLTTVDKILDIEAGNQLAKGKDNQLEKNIAPGIWQIIKLVVDKAVLNRRVVDSSISSASGSLINFFKKVCQDPFVEFYGDTYGDTYNITIRKPPIDRKGILSLLQAQVETEDLVSTGIADDGSLIKNTQTRVTPLIIDVNAEDVLDENLNFDDSEAYSWYHLQPQSVFQGAANQFSLAYLPAIFLNEYAEIWGSKPLQIVHNYMPVIPRDADQKQLSVVQEQAIEDMRFLIESHAYLPFTRKGMLKVNGDRRYKYGNIIRYKPTGEIFFIDGVQQTLSIGETDIERHTVLQVSRGMVEQLIYGIPLANVTNGQIVDYVSYFNIVNTNAKLQYKNFTEFIAQKIQVGEQDISTTLQQSIQAVNSNIPSDHIVMKGGNSNLDLLSTYPAANKARFVQLINLINSMGFWVTVTSAKRTFEQQKALWDTTKLNTRLKAAAPGHSRHETGLAIDLNLTNMQTKYVMTGSAGTVSQNQTMWLSSGVPQAAKLMGFRWGGDSFTGNYDPVHFEIIADEQKPTTFKQPLYQEYQKGVPTKVLDVSKTFSDVHVNKDVFNFFLRKEQFDKKYIKCNGILLDRNDTGKIEQSLPEAIVKSKKK